MVTRIFFQRRCTRRTVPQFAVPSRTSDRSSVSRTFTGVEDTDRDPVLEPVTDVVSPPVMTEQDAPRAPGFRVLVRDAAAVVVPPVRSVLRSLVAVGGLLLVLGLLVGEIDARLARVLLRETPSPAAAGWVAGCLLVLAAGCTAGLPLTLSGAPRPLSRAERRRWAVASILVVSGLLLGLYAAAGAAR